VNDSDRDKFVKKIADGTGFAVERGLSLDDITRVGKFVFYVRDTERKVVAKFCWYDSFCEDAAFDHAGFVKSEFERFVK
jgi:endo-beta-N-acetylglucosaminidase D